MPEGYRFGRPRKFSPRSAPHPGLFSIPARVASATVVRASQRGAEDFRRGMYFAHVAVSVWIHSHMRCLFQRDGARMVAPAYAAVALARRVGLYLLAGGGASNLGVGRL